MNVLQQFVFWLDRHSKILERIETQRADWFERKFDLGKWFPEGCRILDIGPGVGDVTKRLARYSKTRVIATDIIDYRRQGNRDGSFEFILADAKNLPFEDGSFDRVSLFWILHHEKEPEQMLREAHRVLTKDGEIVIIEDVLNRHSKMNKLLLGIYDRVINMDIDAHPHSNKTLSEWQMLVETQLSMQVVETHTLRAKPIHFGVIRCRKA